jgi:hypothetical protein
VNPIIIFLVVMFSVIPLLFTTLIAVRLIHQRPMRTIITPFERIDWRRIFAGFVVWFILSALGSIVESLLYPGRYRLTLDIVQLLPLSIAVLLLMPFQTSAEELFFRGYVLQSFGLRIKNPFLLSCISGFLFTLPHLENPEVSVNFWLMSISYFAIGAFAAWITLKDNRLELALGLHAANNIFTSVFANYTISAIPTPAIFTINGIDATYGLIALIFQMTLFYIILFKPFRRSVSPNLNTI